MPKGAGGWRFAFLLIVCLFGTADLLLTPPLQVPDEQTHFYRAYDVSRGHLIARAPVMLPKSVTALQAQYPPRLEIAWATYRRLTFADLWQSLGDDLRADDTIGVSSAHIYTFVPYLSAALGIFVARHAGASALGVLYAGRLGNLLTYSCLVFWALRRLPALGLPFLLVAVMPMSLQQAASLSADSLSIAATLLDIAVILSLCVPTTKPLTAREYGLALVLGVVVVMAKANVAFLFLPLLIPRARFGGAGKKALLLAAYVTAALLPLLIWQYVNREDIETFRLASLQGGVDIRANVAFLWAHPAGLLRVVLHTVGTQWQDYPAGLVGVVGWNAARLPAWMAGSYLAVIGWAATSAAGPPAESRAAGREFNPSGTQRLILATILMASLLSVFMALWSLETQHRADAQVLVESSTTIANVQGRYFIPILALAVVLFPTRRAWRGDAILATAMVIAANVTFSTIAGGAYYASRAVTQPPAQSQPTNVGLAWGGFYLLQVDDGYREGCQSFHFLNPRVDAVPLVGDWNGDARAKGGVYEKGVFHLDFDGTGRDDRVYTFVPPQAGDVPIVGDWNGDGRTKIGVFRSGFLWILDYNGNGKLDPVSADGDRVFALGGIPMDLPVVGDWTGDGHTKVGIYRHGEWLLQSEDTLSSTVKYAMQRFAVELREEGRDCDIPVVGTWTGDRQTRIGMLLVRNRSTGSRTYRWILDRNGNGMFDGPERDAVFDFGGMPGDVPLVGTMRRAGPSLAGIFRRGVWAPAQPAGAGECDTSKLRQLDWQPGDVAAVEDWTGAGCAQLGVWRSGSWLLK